MSALGIAFTAYMLATSWGGTYALFTTAVALVMSALALLRRWRPPWPAAVGVAVAAAAVGASHAADLPQEPSPIAALALAVLTGSALRAVPAGPAIAVALGGAATTALTWTSGLGTVTALATLLMAGGLVTGLALRAFAPVR
ncbi:hypothetical protein [Actinomadura sediminis]|uniref:Metal transporter n=1 Tax=Actinomadura sediminis TaxID=1038904 RepID=A0ABW3F162_9ACTN